MAFDPSKLAPSLAAVAGAYAAPGNPSLGAQIGAGLGSALFPTQEDKQIQELRDLNIQGAKQNLEFGKTQEERAAASEKRQATLADLQAKNLTQAFDINASQEQRAKSQFEMAQAETKKSLAYDFLKSGADGGGKVALEGLSQVVSQATGRPATADDLAKWQTHPAAMGLVRVQRFIGAVQAMDEANPDQQAAISRFAAEAGLNAKFVDGKLTIVDPFGQSDLNKDGTINAEDISMLKQNLTQTVAKEAGYQQMVQQMATNPTTALVGTATARLAQAYLENTDSSEPSKDAIIVANSIANEVGTPILAAASLTRAFLSNPNDPDLPAYKQAFDAAHKMEGITAIIDESGMGNHVIQISKANPWAQKNLAAIKATNAVGSITEDAYMARIPMAEFAQYVDTNFNNEINKAMPKADPFAKAFNEMSYDGTPILVDAIDEEGKTTKKEIPLGVWAQQKWIDGARAAIAGTNGDQAKITPKEFDQFRKTEEGRFLMRAIAIEANGLLRARQNEQATARKNVLSKGEETRQRAANGDPDSLATVAAVQGIQRKAAGSEPSVAMKRALSDVQREYEDKAKKSKQLPYNPQNIMGR